MVHSAFPPGTQRVVPPAGGLVVAGYNFLDLNHESSDNASDDVIDARHQQLSTGL